jgi:hypothetical protein
MTGWLHEKPTKTSATIVTTAESNVKQKAPSILFYDRGNAFLNAGPL